MTVDISELSVAYTLCMCGDVCTRSCTVCFSVSWQDGPCVKQLWDWHIRDSGAQNDAPGPNGIVCGFHCDRWNINSQCPIHHYPAPSLYTRADLRRHDDGSVSLRQLTNDQIVERCIDVMESSGMTLERWQVQAMRAIFGTHA